MKIYLKHKRLFVIFSGSLGIFTAYNEMLQVPGLDKKYQFKLFIGEEKTVEQ